MADVLGPGGLAAIVMDADPEFTELFRAALRPYDAVARRTDSAGFACWAAATGCRRRRRRQPVLGAYLGQLVRRGAVDEDWLERCLDMMWPILVPPER